MPDRGPFSVKPLSESTLLELYKLTVEEQRRQDEDHRRNIRMVLWLLTALIGAAGYLYVELPNARPPIFFVGGLFVSILAFIGWRAHIHDYERVHKTISVRIKLEADLGMETLDVRQGASRWKRDSYLHPDDIEKRDDAEPEGAGKWYAQLQSQRLWGWHSWMFYLFMLVGLAAVIAGGAGGWLGNHVTEVALLRDLVIIITAPIIALAVARQATKKGN